MERYVAGIGAANVDIYGHSDIKIRMHYDHPSIIHTSVGGVTRNILENISRLGVKSVLLTAVGDDIYADEVINKSSGAGIDTTKVLKVKGGHTGIFMQVQDKNNDMYLAMCDMSITRHIDIDYIKKRDKVLRKASVIIIDPSLSKEVINYILDEYKDIPCFVDPISDNYARKIRPYLSKIFCIKPNVTELSQLANMKIETDYDLRKAVDKVLKKGVKKLYVSLGKKGCLYADSEGNFIRRKFKAVKKMANASGAGDAFFATTVYSYVNGLSIDDTIDKALAAGIAAVRSEGAINKELSVKYLDKIIKEYK